MVLKKDNLITELPYLWREFKISFDVLISKFIGNWQSIIHFTINGDNSQIGDRIPGVWISSSQDFHICQALNGNKKCYTGIKTVVDKWINVEISQTLLNNKAGRQVETDPHPPFSSFNLKGNKYKHVLSR